MSWLLMIIGPRCGQFSVFSTFGQLKNSQQKLSSGQPVPVFSGKEMLMMSLPDVDNLMTRNEIPLTPTVLIFWQKSQ